jgi:hypothetical protein
MKHQKFRTVTENQRAAHAKDTISGWLLTRNLEYQEGGFDPDPEAVAELHGSGSRILVARCRLSERQGMNHEGVAVEGPAEAAQLQQRVPACRLPP